MLKHRGISSRYSARQYMSSKMNLIVNHRPERRTCLAVLATIAFATLSCHDQPTAPRAGSGAPTVPLFAQQISGVQPQVTGGDGSTCALNTDGAVVCWGTMAYYPVPSELTSVTQISAGGSHACARQGSGTVICWGGNRSGELDVPAEIGAIAEIVAGYNHTCALRSDGTVTCWGANELHQTETPVDVNEASQISSDASHTCALKKRGTVVCWGDNRFGQSAVPSDLTSVSQVSAGGYHTCALRTDQTVVCWGANSNGQTSVPTGLNSVAQLTSGYYFSCALKTDANVVCWGDNSRGQTNVTPGLGPARQIAAGGYHSCAIKTEGTVACWGDGMSVPAGLNLIVSQPQVINFTSTPQVPITVGEIYVMAATGGESGNLVRFSSLTPDTCSVQDTVASILTSGSCTIAADQAGNETYLPAPRVEQSFEVVPPLPVPEAVPQIDASENHTCALSSAGRVTCWGFNDYGEASPPPDLPPMRRVAAGGYHSCALEANGHVVCWGHDGYGQATVPTGLTAVAIIAGTYHSCAIKSSGGVLCWGRPDEGQIAVPLGLSAISQMDISAYHSCALKNDGSLVCWGSNAEGQLNTPAGFTYKQVTTGGLTTCTIKIDATVACWGYNGGGQAEVPDALNSVIQISSGGHNCALRRDASVVCWSYNSDGQLNVPAGLRALMVTAGGFHTCAIATSGSVLCWGGTAFNKLAVPGGLNLLGPQTQTITFTSVPANPAQVGSTYQAAAIGGGSGNPVTFSSLTPETCSVDMGGAARIAAAGTCTIAADQAGVGDYLTAPQVQQSFQVIMPNRAPVANAGGPYSGDEGSAIRFDGHLSSDPDGNALTYAWDFGDGTQGVGVAPTHAYQDNRYYIVSLTVGDGELISSAVATSAAIANVAPTGAFVFSSSVNESYNLAASAISLSLVNAADPSSADTQGGLRFAFICSGEFGTISYATATTANAALCPAYDGPSTTIAKARVFDKDGGWSEYTSSQITINNVAPTVILGGPDCDCLSPTFGFSFFDPAGNLDRTSDGGFSVNLKWGDKTKSVYSTYPGNNTVGHVYAKGGSYSLVAVVTDKDYGAGTATVSFTLTQPVTISVSPATISKSTKTLSVDVAGTSVVDGGLIAQTSLRLGRTAVWKDARGKLQCATRVNGTTGFTDLDCQFDVAEMRTNGDLVGTGLRTLVLTGSIPSDERKIRGSAAITLK